jgi:ABC-2 type transport system permease protein
MINLVRNENMKLYSRISTWIMAVLLIVMVIGMGALTRFMIKDPAGGNWKESLKKQNESLRSTISKMADIKSTKDQYMKMIAINEYSIEHNIPPESSNTLWGFVASAAGAISFISLFTIIIGAGTVASEFTEGTIKLLLIRPSKRWKILLSKYISTLIATLFMLVLLFAVSFIVGSIFFGFGGLSQPHLSYMGGEVKEVSMIGYVFSQYGYNCVALIMMATFAFMISTVFRNSSLAIGLSIFLMFTGNTIVQFLSRYSWVKYILFANTNLAMYSDGIPIVEGMTLGFSIIVLIVYFIAFCVISWAGFTKRDVAA